MFWTIDLMGYAWVSSMPLFIPKCVGVLLLWFPNLFQSVLIIAHEINIKSDTGMSLFNKKKLQSETETESGNQVIKMT